MRSDESPRRRLHGAVVRSLLGALALGASTAAAEAQVVRGSVRTLDTSLPVPGAEVSIRDSVGSELAKVFADEQGFFLISLRDVGVFSVQARRLGFQMAATNLLKVEADTVSLEFQLAEIATDLDAVTVTGMAALNAQRLEEAERRGWSIYEPELVSQHRSRSRDLTELLRSLGPRHLQMPRNPRDCVRSMRNNQCITYVVDGQVLGPEAYVLPEDIYFLAVLTPTESATMYGNRAIHGAVVIYTRMNGDRYNQDQLPPHMRRLEPPRNARSGTRPPIWR